jgi:hypothetical protein
VSVHYIVFLWVDPHLYLVLRCSTACRRADVRVRYPDLFDFCARCGGYAFTTAELRADGSGVARGPIN